MQALKQGKQRPISIFTRRKVKPRYELLRKSMQVPILTLQEKHKSQSYQTIDPTSMRNRYQIKPIKKKLSNLSQSANLKQMIASKLNQINDKRSIKHTSKSNMQSLDLKNYIKMPIINQLIYDTQINSLICQLNIRKAEKGQEVNDSGMKYILREKLQMQRSYLLPLHKVRNNHINKVKTQVQELPHISEHSVRKKPVSSGKHLLKLQKDNKICLKGQQSKKYYLGQKNPYSAYDLNPWQGLSSRQKTTLEDLYC